jgi:glycosyltransferase involved in cell wall biosynthesis
MLEEEMKLIAQASSDLWEAATTSSVPGIGTRAAGRDVLMLVVSDLRIDPRVEREARALAAAGYRVTVLCPDPTLGQVEDLSIDWGDAVEVRFIAGQASQFVMERPGFAGGLIYRAALAEATARQPLAIHSHDLNTCLIGLAVSRQIGAYFVADFHEWTSENVHWDQVASQWAPYPDDWKAELQALERRVMKEASAAITVCDSIADAIADELGQGRRPTVIRNIPALAAETTREYPPLKQQLGLSSDQFVLLWQGGTGPTRLIEPIIEALRFTPDCTLVIRGPSLDLFGGGYRKLAESIGAADRLILQDALPSRDVVAAARGADAGIWTLPELCRNFTYALPNKIFEYIASGLPLLVADYPEARRIVQKHGIGITFDPYDPRSIADAINRLIHEPELTQGFRANTTNALVTLDASKEWDKIVDLYDALVRDGGPQQGQGR